MTTPPDRPSDDTATLLAYYATTLALIRQYPPPHPLYRALCQVRAELERTLRLSPTPTRRRPPSE